MSSLLLAAGVILVFTGLYAALGFTPIGFLTSATAVISLLYAGAMWSRTAKAPRGPRVLLFDRELHPVAGGDVFNGFAEPIRREVCAHARAALSGKRVRFVVDQRTFLAAPVIFDNGGVHYALLVEGTALEGPAQTSQLAT